jgi:hypothetical protein
MSLLRGLEVAEPKMPMKWRYVELSYELPDGKTDFFATVGRTESPNVALLTAVEMCKMQHPDATSIEEFVLRVVTPERAQAISMLMEAGQWQGWDFKTEHH